VTAGRWFCHAVRSILTIGMLACAIDAAAGEPADGAAPSVAKITGFYDGLAAYTYGEPEHWSRAVSRLQLAGTGKLAENVKWKLSGRADVDPIYFGSDFYPDRVKHDQRARFFHGENYVDISSGNWDITLGAQQIVWGEVVGLFFADVVSARDLREFLLPSFDVIRIPQWAGRADYFLGNDSHVELIWIPVPVFDQIGKPGSDFYPAPLPSPTPQAIADLFHDPRKPDRDLGNSNYGIRGSTLVGGYDLSAFFYRSFSTSPTFYRVPGDTPTQPFAFEPRYDRIWQVGSTVSKDFESFVVRGEAVYTHGQGYAVADLTAADSVVKRNTLDYIVSVEWPLPHDSRVNVQLFQRVFAGGASDLAIRNDGVGASIFASTKLTSAWEPQILWIQNFRDAGGLVRPRINWYPAQNYTVAFGFDVFTGPSNGYFGRYDNRDRAYAELRYDF
jgi:hypothetical protein